MKFYDGYKKLLGLALGLFLLLAAIVAIILAINNQKNNTSPQSAQALGGDAVAGKQIFIANGCVACHTQRGGNLDGDKTEISTAGYADTTPTNLEQNTAKLTGTERAGPDLTNIGERRPHLDWNLLHLYQPRAAVEKSTMPAFPWLFEIKDSVSKGEIEISVPNAFRKGIDGKIVAKKEALDLVAYLQNLKQATLPANTTTKNETGYANPLNGHMLYTRHCSSCHQPNGEGLKNAFPPLNGSPIVLANNPDLLVNIIMTGYDARAEYAAMNAVGLDNDLSAEEITEIINYVNTSWGNNAKQVKTEDVKNRIDIINMTAKN